MMYGFWRIKHPFFGKWTLNQCKITDWKRLIQDGSSNLLTPQKVFFPIHHKSYTLFFSFWKFKLSSKKTKENVAGSNSDLQDLGLYFLCILKSAVSLQLLITKSWNFGFIIPSRWFSWKYLFKMIFRISMIPLSQHISDS